MPKYILPPCPVDEGLYKTIKTYVKRRGHINNLELMKKFEVDWPTSIDLISYMIDDKVIAFKRTSVGYLTVKKKKIYDR